MFNPTLACLLMIVRPFLSSAFGDDFGQYGSFETSLSLKRTPGSLEGKAFRLYCRDYTDVRENPRGILRSSHSVLAQDTAVESGCAIGGSILIFTSYPLV